LAIMILPTITSVTVEVLRTVPGSLREAAFALGATRWEAVRTAVLPYGKAGILGASILGLGRALGETMAVTMVIGNSPTIRASLLGLVSSRGIGGLSLSFFAALPKPVGEVGGGIGNAILGTAEIVAMGCLIGIPLGIGAGVFLAERGNGPVGSTVRFVAELLS